MAFTGTIRTKYRNFCDICKRWCEVGDMVYVKPNKSGTVHLKCWDMLPAKQVVTVVINKTQAVNNKKDTEISKLKKRIKELEVELLYARDEILILKKIGRD